MITTTAAGRTWHFDRSLGRPTNEHNGKVGGYRYPVDLAIAPDGNIFVLSHGNQFGGGQIGYRDNGRVGKTTFDEHHLGDFARREFTWPAGIAVDSEGWVYVSDEHENVIKKFDPEATHPFPTYEPGRGGSRYVRRDRRRAWDNSDGPTGVQFDANDNLYVVESRNNRVQKFTKDGKFLLAFGGPGTGEAREFNRPWGITIDRSGDVYVADWGNDRIQKFSPEGEYLMSFGEEYGGELTRPANVAVDSGGDVYVTDFGNRRVQVYEPNGDILTSFYGDATTLSKAGEYIIRRDPWDDQGLSYGQGLHIVGQISEADGYRDRRSRPRPRGRPLRQTPGVRQGPRLRRAGSKAGTGVALQT